MKQDSPIVLIGMKHTGKTTIGKILATQLQGTFFDTDAVIAEIAGKSVRDLFDSGGSQLLQLYETQALEHIFTTRPSAVKPSSVEPSSIELSSVELSSKIVIATGGGLADNNEAIHLIKENGTSIYLDTSFEILFSRIMNSAEQDGRLPLFLQGGDPEILFRDLFSRRSKIYATICDIVIYTGARMPPVIASTIMEYILHE